MSNGNKDKTLPTPNGIIIGGNALGLDNGYIKEFPDTDNAKSTSRAIRYWKFEDKLKYLMGRVLTIVDASNVPSSQTEATKSLIKQDFSNVLHEVSLGCYPNSPGFTLSNNQ